MTLGGEGGAGQMGVVIPPNLVWDDDLSTPIKDASAKRILFNITAALQWSGFSVAFLYEENS